MAFSAFLDGATCATYPGLAAFAFREGRWMHIEIPESLSAYVDGALVRLQSQFPALGFQRCASGLLVDIRGAGAREIELRSAVLHSVYREKIYVETLPMRKSLLAAVMK